MKEFRHFQLTPWGHVKCHRTANLCCVGFHWVRGTAGHTQGAWKSLKKQQMTYETDFAPFTAFS